MATEPWHGAVLVVLSPRHGIDVGDLAALAALVLAGIVLSPTAAGRALRRTARAAAAGPLGDPVPARVAAGVALVVAGAVGLTDADPGRAPDAVLALGTAALVAWAGATAGPRAWSALAVSGPGYLLDALAVPTGTAFGPAALAVAAAVAIRWGPAPGDARPSDRATGTGSGALEPVAAGRTARVGLRGTGRAPALALAFTVVATACVTVSVAALADLSGLDVLVSRFGDGGARTLALGVELLLAGVARGAYSGTISKSSKRAW
ncbi:MAG: hypothetical protein AB7L84_05245 [Acidimicrobiia bacterium]